MVARSSVIDYEATFSFPAPVEHVWATIGRFDRYPSWWSWLHDFNVEGETLEPGTALHGTVVPPLPYRMHLDVVIEQLVPERLIAASVRGDLEGEARLTFERDGDQTRVCARWTIEMKQQTMRVAARMAYPVLRWGHDRVVEATVSGFRRHLSD